MLDKLVCVGQPRTGQVGNGLSCALCHRITGPPSVCFLNVCECVCLCVCGVEPAGWQTDGYSVQLRHDAGAIALAANFFGWGQTQTCRLLLRSPFMHPASSRKLVRLLVWALVCPQDLLLLPCLWPGGQDQIVYVDLNRRSVCGVAAAVVSSHLAGVRVVHAEAGTVLLCVPQPLALPVPLHPTTCTRHAAGIPCGCVCGQS